MIDFFRNFLQPFASFLVGHLVHRSVAVARGFDFHDEASLLQLLPNIADGSWSFFDRFADLFISDSKEVAMDFLAIDFYEFWESMAIVNNSQHPFGVGEKLENVVHNPVQMVPSSFRKRFFRRLFGSFHLVTPAGLDMMTITLSAFGYESRANLPSSFTRGIYIAYSYAYRSPLNGYAFSGLFAKSN